MSMTALLENIAIRWNDLGVCYAIVRGVEDCAQGAGRNVGVLIAPEHWERALLSAIATLRECDLTTAPHVAIWGGRRIGETTREVPEHLELHLFRRLTWRNVLLVERPSPSRSTGPFAVDPWAGFVKRALLPLLAGDWQRFTAGDRLRFQAGEELAALPQLHRLVGGTLGELLVGAIAAGDIPATRRWAKDARITMMRRALQARPLRSVGLIGRAAVRGVRQSFRAPTPVVALVGPRGKRMALIEAIVAGKSLVFTGVLVRRPKAPARGAIPARYRWVVSHRWLEFLRLLGDRIASSRHGLVIYDGLPEALHGGGDRGVNCSSYSAGPFFLSGLDLVIAVCDAEAVTAVEGIDGWTHWLSIAWASDAQMRLGLAYLPGAPEQQAQRLMELIDDILLRKMRE